jgi:hypothetical protein
LCRHVRIGASLGRSHRPQGAVADGSEEGRGRVKPVTLPVGEAREVDLCRAGEREGEGAEASGRRGERVWRADLRQGEHTRGEEEGRGGEERVGGRSEHNFYIIDLGFVEASVF